MCSIYLYGYISTHSKNLWDFQLHFHFIFSYMHNICANIYLSMESWSYINVDVCLVDYVFCYDRQTNTHNVPVNMFTNSDLSCRGVTIHLRWDVSYHQPICSFTDNNYGCHDLLQKVKSLASILFLTFGISKSKDLPTFETSNVCHLPRAPWGFWK